MQTTLRSDFLKLLNFQAEAEVEIERSEFGDEEISNESQTAGVFIEEIKVQAVTEQESEENIVNVEI